MKIAISNSQKTEIISILSKFNLETIAFAYGSRTKNTHRKYSDLDIVLKNKTPLAKETIWNLHEEFSESSLPFQIEVRDWSILSPEFQNRIEDDLVPFVPAIVGTN